MAHEWHHPNYYKKLKREASSASKKTQLNDIGYSMKVRSKHNSLLNYFIVDHKYLSKEYIRKCKKFFQLMLRSGTRHSTTRLKSSSCL